MSLARARDNPVGKIELYIAAKCREARKESLKIFRYIIIMGWVGRTGVIYLSIENDIPHLPNMNTIASSEASAAMTGVENVPKEILSPKEFIRRACHVPPRIWRMF